MYYNHQRQGANMSKRLKKLTAKLNEYLNSLKEERFEEIDGGEKCHDLNDTGLWIGRDQVSQYSKCNAEMVFHFDGAGYDMFSEEGDYVGFGLSKYRDMIFNIAEKHGFHAEPLNNWSIGFYWDGV